MHFLHSIAKWPNLELKTRPKQLLGSLPLDIALPAEVCTWYVVLILLWYSTDGIMFAVAIATTISCSLGRQF
jgi:hypothetical protein